MKIKILKLINILQNFLFATLVLYAPSTYAQDNQDPATIEYRLIEKGDILHEIACSADLGLDEILQANPSIKDPNLIYAGKKIILPIIHLVPDAKPEGIVINLAEPRLYFFSDEKMTSFPASVGADEKTPVGKTKVIAKRKNPYWIPPLSIREKNPELPEIVPSGADNPLGERAIYLDASRNFKWQNIVIHGTNAPWTIGSKVSHGCIRLYPQDIEKLFDEVEIGTMVTVVNQPIKISELNNKIYLEVHLAKNSESLSENIDVKKLICRKIADCKDKINWQKVNDAMAQNLGIPTDISL